MAKIIAEIGWNHMGDMKLAKEMISAAKESGADFAKFQTWSVDRLKPGVWDTDGRREIYKKAELDLNKHIELKEYCDKVSIGFMSSVFSIKDAKLLKQVINDYVKIPSFESRNKNLIKYCTNNFNHLLISTGTSNLDEIEQIINLRMFKCKYTLLHCVSSYPCSHEIVNLPRINHLKKLCSSVGFSDHTKDVDVSILALGYNLDFIEKHFTIDNNLPGRDNKFAILPKELKRLKNNINIFTKVNRNLGGSYQKCELDSRDNYTGRFDG